MDSSSARAGFLALHASIFLFGLSALFGKTIQASPIVVTCLRSLVGSGALTAFLLLRHGRSPWSWTLVLRTIPSGALLAIHWSSFYASIQWGSVALGLLTCAAYPMFVVLLAWCVDRRRPTGGEWICAAVVLVGLLLLVPWEEVLASRLDRIWWFALGLGLLAALTFAGLTLINRGLVRAQGPLEVVMAQMFWAGLILLPLSATAVSAISMRDQVLLLLLGVVFTATAHGLFTVSLRTVPVTIVGITSALEPVYGMGFAWLIVQETPTLLMVAGGALIIGAGVAMLWLESSRPADELLP